MLRHRRHNDDFVSPCLPCPYWQRLLVPFRRYTRRLCYTNLTLTFGVCFCRRGFWQAQVVRDKRKWLTLYYTTRDRKQVAQLHTAFRNIALTLPHPFLSPRPGSVWSWGTVPISISLFVQLSYKIQSVLTLVCYSSPEKCKKWKKVITLISYRWVIMNENIIAGSYPVGAVHCCCLSMSTTATAFKWVMRVFLNFSYVPSSYSAVNIWRRAL